MVAEMLKTPRSFLVNLLLLDTLTQLTSERKGRYSVASTSSSTSVTILSLNLGVRHVVVARTDSFMLQSRVQQLTCGKRRKRRDFDAQGLNSGKWFCIR